VARHFFASRFSSLLSPPVCAGGAPVLHPSSIHQPPSLPPVSPPLLSPRPTLSPPPPLPFTDKFFETFSFLPPLSDAEVAKQVDYITRNGWVPGLEFADAEHAYVSSENCIRIAKTPGYQGE